jgi:hypothetical protein
MFKLRTRPNPAHSGLARVLVGPVGMKKTLSIMIHHNAADNSPRSRLVAIDRSIRARATLEITDRYRDPCLFFIIFSLVMIDKL